MAPTTVQLTSQLRQIIWYHLDNESNENALFFAGRLHAIDPRNPDSVHILALCHLRCGQIKAAHDQCRVLALKKEHLGCSYIFAQSCLALEKYSDGISAIERSRSLWDGKSSANRSGDWPRRCLPDASAFQCLLGKLCHSGGDVKKAAECYEAALRLNPFMWDAFERLCDTGSALRPSQMFKEDHISQELLAALDPSSVASTAAPAAVTTHVRQASTSIPQPSDPFKLPGDSGLSLGEINLLAKPNSRPQLFNVTSNESSLETPPRGEEGNALVSKESNKFLKALTTEPPNAPLRKPRMHATGLPGVQSGADVAKLRASAASGKPRIKEGIEVAESQDPLKTSSATAPFNKRTVSGNAAQMPKMSNTMDPNAAPQRRSVRLNPKIPAGVNVPGPKDPSDLKKAKATGTKGRAAALSSVGRVVSGNRKPTEVGPTNEMKEVRQNAASRAETSQGLLRPASDAPPRDTESLSWLLDLLCRLGQGYFSLARFECKQALQHFQSISPQQRETPWALAQIGKAQYENNDHTLAERTFSRLRKLAPWRLQDMEIYSTLLWHLKSELELAHLSHELIEHSGLSPEAWCTVGNSFSLQRDHEQALKCFRRSTQLDPSFAYGFTLQGHEHVSNEDFDRALQSYRRAIAANNRHYNGWYGIGRVYEKLGKFDMAEKHYRAASSINPGNSILICHIGTVLDKQGSTRAALVEYNKACEMAPKSAMSRFKRARTCLKLHDYHGALQEFLVLKDMAPDEANVHFMLGKTYKTLNDRANAIKHFTTALNLDPKAGPLIKEHMEALGEGTFEDEDEDDDDEPMD